MAHCSMTIIGDRHEIFQVNELNIIHNLCKKLDHEMTDLLAQNVENPVD